MPSFHISRPSLVKSFALQLQHGLNDLSQADESTDWVTGKWSGNFYRTRDGLRDFISLLIDVREQQAFATCNLGVHCTSPISSLTSSHAVPRTMLTRNIGYLMPSKTWREWRITDGSVDCVVGMLDGIREFGMDWLDSFQSVGDVERELKCNQRQDVAIRRLAQKSVPA